MLIKVAAPHLAAIVSIILSLVLANPGPGLAAVFFGIFGIASLIFAVVVDISLITQRVKSFTTDALGRAKIVQYMHDLISNAGTIAIFTHDMTGPLATFGKSSRAKLLGTNLQYSCTALRPRVTS